MMYLRPLFFLTLIFITSTKSSAEIAKNKAPLEITVERSATDDLWTVTYHFDWPVKKIYFIESSHAFRRKNYEIMDPSSKFIENEDGKELFISETPRRDFTFKHKSIDTGFEHGHEFHMPFSNNDMLIYLGYYSVYVVDTETRSEPITAVKYKFINRKDGYIFVKGQKFEHEATWQSNESQYGTFVFFGKQKIQTPSVLFQTVLDEKLPEWIVRSFKPQGEVEQLFTYFNQRLFSLTFKPTLFFAYSTPDLAYAEDAHTITGRVVAGAKTVMMGIRGDRYKNETKINRFALLSSLLFHENIHLWNAESVATKSDEPWLWEGGAEALSQLAIQDLGLVDPECYRWYRRVAHDQCKALLQSALSSGDKKFRQSNEFAYRCGRLVGELSHLAIKKSVPAFDLFTIWSKVYEDARESNAVVSTALYLKTVRAFVVEKDVLAAIDELLSGELTEDLAALTKFDAALKHFGEDWYLRNNDQCEK